MSNRQEYGLDTPLRNTKITFTKVCTPTDADASSRMAAAEGLGNLVSEIFCSLPQIMGPVSRYSLAFFPSRG